MVHSSSVKKVATTSDVENLESSLYPKPCKTVIRSTDEESERKTLSRR